MMSKRTLNKPPCQPPRRPARDRILPVRSGKLKDDERRRRVVALFLQRPPEKRTENDVLAFYGWLEQNRRELLKRGQGDPYQQLKVDLRGYIQ